MLLCSSVGAARESGDQAADESAPEPAAPGSDADAGDDDGRARTEPSVPRRESNEVVWPGRRFTTADWVITAAGASIAIGALIVPPRSQHLRGGVLFDEDARDALRLGSSGMRSTARLASDVTISLEVAWPFVVDALVATWWQRRSPETAVQMALVDAQALAIVTALQGITNTAVSRERPYGRDCGASLPAGTSDCEGSVRYRSFFSGHAAVAFTSASLVCMHHAKLDLFGGGAPEVIACVTAYTGAAATAALRVMADVHYASDVLVGAAVGTLVGVAIPLWHHRPARTADAAGGRQRVDVQIAPVAGGIGLTGSF